MTIGIDVSKEQLVTGSPSRPLGALTNTVAGIKELLSKAEPGDIIAMEATGNYHKLLANTAFEMGFTVLVFNPKDVQRFASSISPRAKTDKVDARVIALFAQARDHRPYNPTPKLADSIRSLARARSRLVTQKVSNQNQASSNPASKSYLVSAINGLKESIKDLDKQIAQLARQLPQFQLLDGIPGFAELTASYMLAMLQCGVFATSDSFVAFLGLDIRVKQSGKRAGKRCLTKRGDPEARRLLYLAAQAAIRSSAPFHQIYLRSLANGRSKTEATVAVARKLARVAWSVYKKNQPYQPDRVLHQPGHIPAPVISKPISDVAALIKRELRAKRNRANPPDVSQPAQHPILKGAAAY